MADDKTSKPTNEAMKDYDPKDRDFQRTEEDLDNVSKSEKDFIEEEKQKDKKEDSK